MRFGLRKEVKERSGGPSTMLPQTNGQKKEYYSGPKGEFGDTSSFSNLLNTNAAWRSYITTAAPKLLPTLAQAQHPHILWLGCSDSRVPETTILGLQPGDVFVHRNIANILHTGDINVNAVIEYAVLHLKVSHVVVAGHTGCGGVAAALGNKRVGGVLDTWIAPLRQLRRENTRRWDAEGLSEKERAQRLVEANVRRGVEVVREKDAIISAVSENRLQVHGVVYDIGSGELRVLDCDEQGGDEDKDRAEAFRLD